MKKEDILKKNKGILEYYGMKNQTVVWIEEMSELTKELCKFVRSCDENSFEQSPRWLDDLKEEIADVTVCLDQLKFAIDFTEEELMELYEQKVDRQVDCIIVEDRKCEDCIKWNTSYCPKSNECFEKLDKPHYQSKIMLLEENQELKEQLEIGEEQYNDLVEDYENLIIK